MLIIDRFTDYYDYVSHIYGVDKKIVFDRRESVNIDDEMLAKHILDCYDLETEFYGIRFKPNTIIGYFFLETGDVQYLFELKITRYVKTYSSKPDRISYTFDYKLIEKYEEHKNLFGHILSIKPIRQYYVWDFPSFLARNEDKNKKLASLEEMVRAMKEYRRLTGVNLPILAETKITSLIEPDEIWKNIMNYISSLDNDKDVSIPMTDKDKAKNHGFDDGSFRHPIK